jgi:hypothetical protein
MTLDTDSVIFTVSIIISGIIYGQYMFRQGFKYGADETIDGLENAGIIDINENGEILPKKK